MLLKRRNYSITSSASLSIPRPGDISLGRYHQDRVTLDVSGREGGDSRETARSRGSMGSPVAVRPILPDVGGNFELLLFMDERARVYSQAAQRPNLTYARITPAGATGASLWCATLALQSNSAGYASPERVGGRSGFPGSGFLVRSILQWRS